MKAADITTERFLAEMDRLALRHGQPPRWVDRWALAEALEVPPKVLLAKARRLIRREVIDGCACGCRGDFVRPQPPLDTSRWTTKTTLPSSMDLSMGVVRTRTARIP